MRLLLALLCVCVSSAQETRVRLKEETKDLCEKTGGFIENPSDCCEYIQCKGDFGFRKECPPGTVWRADYCLCFDSIFDETCNISTCGRERKFDENPNLLTSLPCPDFLPGEEYCCNGENGLVFERVDESHYRLDTDHRPQLCPLGTKFFKESCCCEGKFQVEPSSCLHFGFNGFTDSDGNVKGDAFKMEFEDQPLDSLLPPAAVKAALFRPDTSFSIPRFAFHEIRDQFYASAWVRRDEATSFGVMHNGAPQGGGGATFKVEIVECPRETLVVAGLYGCDRTEDIMAPVQMPVGEWTHFEFIWDDGLLTLNVGDQKYVAREDASVDDDLLKTVIEKTITEIENCEFPADADPSFALFLDEDVMPVVDVVTNFLDRDFDKLRESGRQTLTLYEEALRRAWRLEEFFTMLVAEVGVLKPLVLDKLNPLRSDLGIIATNVRSFFNGADATKTAELLNASLETKQAVKKLRGLVLRLEDLINGEFFLLSNAFGTFGIYEPIFQLIDAFTASVGRKRRAIANLHKRALGQLSVPRTTKHPMYLGDQLIGAYDEFVYCGFIPSDDDLDALRMFGSIPRIPQGKWY